MERPVCRPPRQGATHLETLAVRSAPSAPQRPSDTRLHVPPGPGLELCATSALPGQMLRPGRTGPLVEGLAPNRLRVCVLTPPELELDGPSVRPVCSRPDLGAVPAKRLLALAPGIDPLGHRPALLAFRIAPLSPFGHDDQCAGTGHRYISQSDGSSHGRRAPARQAPTHQLTRAGPAPAWSPRRESNSRSARCEHDPPEPPASDCLSRSATSAPGARSSAWPRGGATPRRAERAPRTAACLPRVADR